MARSLRCGEGKHRKDTSKSKHSEGLKACDIHQHALQTLVSSFEPPTMHELETGAVYSVKYASKPQERAKSYSSAAKDFSQFPDKSKQPQKDFTRAEVAKYDGEDGRPIYLIFDTGVYDVTDYVAFHPAGPEPIKKHSGEDVTEVMKATSMPQWVYDKLFTFKVGQVTD